MHLVFSPDRSVLRIDPSANFCIHPGSREEERSAIQPKSHPLRKYGFKYLAAVGLSVIWPESGL
jgi:hypothetical protein